MTFNEALSQTIAMLHQHGRVSYRALKRQFAIQDNYLEDLKDALLFAHPEVLDEEGRGLVWTGGPATRTNKDSLLQLYIAEYKALRQEFVQRLQLHNQTQNYLLVLLAATATAITAVAQQSYFITALLIICAFLPVITAPLAFLYFDQEMAMDTLRTYVDGDLRRRMQGLVGEDYQIHNIWRFAHLPTGGWNIFRGLLIGKWMLFLMPMALPIGFVIWILLPPRSLLPQPVPMILRSIVYSLPVIDVLLTLQLARAVFWVIRKYWAKPPGAADKALYDLPNESYLPERQEMNFR